MIVIYMGTHTTDPAREVMDSIRRLVRLLRVFDSEAQKTAGFSAAQVFVLRQLRDGDEASINELARRTCTDQSSVSVVVAKLVRAGTHRAQAIARATGAAPWFRSLRAGRRCFAPRRRRRRSG